MTRAQLSVAYDPPAGSFTFQSGYPWELTSQWVTGKANTLDTGAIMAFESVTGLTMDGDAGPSVWPHLLSAVAEGKTNPNGYTYSLVNQASPKTLRVYHNGHQIETTLVNTGIPNRSTVDGTFPVYSRFQVTQMSGNNPTAPSTTTRCTGCPISTAATRCTTSRALATATTRALGA